jgi:hypothetical protein
VAYASFSIHDGTGELRVTLEDRVGSLDLPVRGERVEVTGLLRVSGDGQKRLRAQALERIKDGS